MDNAHRFEDWIRGPFVAMNTELENIYFAQPDRMAVENVGAGIKQALRDEGRALIVPLLEEGKTGDGFVNAFGVLGNVGLYMGAMRRHELTHPDREDRSPFEEASALALHIGVSIGMAPRFATAHLATHNPAVQGLRKSFTSLPDEFLFIDENTRGILAFQCAADALNRIVPLGVTSPVADVLYQQARHALSDVIRVNDRLFENLDIDRFFFSVRPYYKPYRVGRQVYRGANAGDFAGINEIDLMLGLCRANDPYYSQLLHEKMPFMLPSEQRRLNACMSRRSLLDDLLLLLDDHATAPWFRNSVRLFLEVCDLFAATARQHHDQLVRRFIEQPSDNLSQANLSGITASGPALDALIRSLEKLRDYRCAADRPDVPTRHRDLARLRAAVDG
ncbi:PrnB family protein [Hephaestia mangrovi]|uniref:PrnB family protein n=1 Tax=Hephaestia mangrovi TaxID=2873268 RepID=UPI001CA6AB58|nr:monodechloroaminopyrrolnitrin synthase PrnB family protein [Hephaestia mangrovi]MBY8829332.1 DUF1864 family protein [Hephaestia mangrovi]